jgi:hypothetical protein
MIGVATFATLALYRDWRGWRRSDVLPPAIGAAAILYSVVYMTVSGSNYGEFQSGVTTFMPNLRDAEFVRLLSKFAIINIELFGIISVFECALR